MRLFCLFGFTIYLVSCKSLSDSSQLSESPTVWSAKSNLEFLEEAEKSLLESELIKNWDRFGFEIKSVNFDAKNEKFNETQFYFAVSAKWHTTRNFFDGAFGGYSGSSEFWVMNFGEPWKLKNGNVYSRVDLEKLGLNRFREINKNFIVEKVMEAFENERDLIQSEQRNFGMTPKLKVYGFEIGLFKSTPTKSENKVEPLATFEVRDTDFSADPDISTDPALIDNFFENSESIQAISTNRTSKIDPKEFDARVVRARNSKL